MVESRLPSSRNRYDSVAALASASGSGLSWGKMTIGPGRAIAWINPGSVARLFPACAMRVEFERWIIAAPHPVVHAVCSPRLFRRSDLLTSTAMKENEPARGFFLDRY